MKKYLIFAMLLLAVLACKPKQKPGVRGVISGGGGSITLPPTVQTKEELEIKTVFTSVVGDYDRTDGWKDSEWKDIPRLTESDIGQITNGGFFVSQYSKENWIVFSINHERNIYTGLSKGAGKLQEAIDMLADEKGNLKEEAWDPRKLLFNQVQDKEDPDRLLYIAWLGRAMWDEHYTDRNDTSYRDYDTKYANALKYLNGDAKTYGILRNYRSEKYSDWITDNDLMNTEGYSWKNGETFVMEDALGDEDRKVWAYFLYDPLMPNHVHWELPGPRYTQGSGITRVSLLRGMRFAYAKKEGGYPGGSSQYHEWLNYFNLGKLGTKAVPKDAKWADRVNASHSQGYGTNGKYHDEYNNMYPRGKIVFDRDPINSSGKARVLFLSTVVAFNLRMRDAKDPNAGGILGEKYNVKEAVFEFDAASFKDLTGDRFSEDDLPIRQGVGETDDIISTIPPKPGAWRKVRDGLDEITGPTHKMPLLYFSPK